LLVLLFVGVVTPALAKDASRRPIGIDDYFALKNVSDPRISPDGKWVTYSVRTQDLENDSRQTRIWMVPTEGGDAIPMTANGNSAWQH
jgi:dipeptidyl aminopeptidase/acylaminoacyl peptidase